jgi:hypothetical protein
MLLATLALMSQGAGKHTPRFPEWKPLPLGWQVLWERSPQIVIGELRHVRSFGVQTVRNLPWPAQDVRRIYWCQADLVTRSVIRGQVPSPGKKFLWGSGFPGCGLAPLKTDTTYGPTTELWFIREEKEYIRPFSDMRSRYVSRELGRAARSGPPDEVCVTPA